jgi:gliding motility-associated-like protein
MQQFSTKLWTLLCILLFLNKFSFAQVNQTENIQNTSFNFTSFHKEMKVSPALYERYNGKQSQSHPDYGMMPQSAPCTECVELLDKRNANERAFADVKDRHAIYIQKSVGDLNYKKDGRWIAIDDRFKQIGAGNFLSNYYLQPVGINTNEKRAFIQTPQGKIYFNQWKLYAQTGNTQTLLDQPDWSHFTAGDDGVFITNIFKGIDAELVVYRGTIKTSFIVKSNEYGSFDKLLFRDEYKGEHPATLAFAADKNLKNGSGALEVTANNEAVLKVYEAIIYPKNSPKNSITTAAYSIHDNAMDIEIPSTWIQSNIGSSPLVIDPVVTGTATLTQGNILGSMYNASCAFNNSCDYNLNVSIPAATTVTAVSFNFTYNATSVCTGSDGGVKISSGTCNTPIYLNQSTTPGPTYLLNVPILNNMQACVPATSCSTQTMPFTLHFYRKCVGPTGCDNTCIAAYSPWIMTIKANTVEFNNPTDPIGSTALDICVGNSIYVTTFALNGVAPYNYNWSFNATGTPSLGTGNSTNINFPNVVNNTIFAIITDACGNTAVDSLPITVNYAAVTATPSSDTICNGQTTGITLTGQQAGTTFTWTAAATGVSGAANGNGNVIAQTLTATGSTPGVVIYTITPHNAGCTGNIITVPVHVFPPITIVKNIGVCVNNLPYIWNGQSYSSGGNAIASFTTPSLLTGCDSTTVLNLTVNPTLTHTQNLTICGGQLPYHWNGHILTAGGTHIDSFKTNSFQFNCDSTTYLNLSIVNTLTDTVTRVICQNQLPYLWNGISVTAGGNAAATLNSTSASTGCDSIAVLRLIVNPLQHVNVTANICPNQLPYHWNGLTFNTTDSGNFVTPSLVTGCDSTTTLHLIVHPVITATQNVTICASSLPYHWHGNTVNAGGAAAATFTTPSLLTGCDSITTLNLTVNPLISVTKTITICANALPYHWNGMTINAGGNGVAMYTTASAVTGCDSTTHLNLIVNPLQNITVSKTICASQLPYHWNNITVNAGGNNVATYTTPSTITGCDSTTHLNLIVNPTLTAIVNRTVCANALPYSWNGLNVTAGGATAATFTTTSLVTSCDSITTLNLTVTPIISVNKNITICVSQLPYHWNGLTVSAAGIGVATFNTTSTATGCDSITVLNLTTNPLITATKTITICNSQLPYHWNGFTITAAGIGVATFTTSSLVTGCDSTTTLNLNVNPVLTANKTITKCSSQMPFSWNGITVNTAGTNIATYTTPSLVTGCDSTTHLSVIVNPILTAVQNINICAMQLPYHWHSQTLTSGGNGVATFTTSSLVTGCDSTTTLNLIVTPTLVDTIFLTKCANQLPFVWNGITVMAGGPAAANYLTPGSNTCDSITTLNLTVNPVPNTAIDTSICYNQSPYHWNGQTYNASGTYHHTATGSNGCDSLSTLHLTIYSAPFNLPSKDSVGCGSVTYRGNVYYSNATIRDTLRNQNGCDSTYQNVYVRISTAFNDTLKASICAYDDYKWNDQNYNKSGNYTQRFNSFTGCDSTITLQLNVWPLTQASIQSDLKDIPCTNDSIEFRGSGSNEYSWKLNSVFVGIADDAKLPLSLPVNTIFVTAKDLNGCESTASVNVETKACCQIMIPNAFSPNGDGLNDKFGAESAGNPLDYEMRIYNRYGQLLFTSHSIESKWDGTYGGKPVDMGTYFYKIYTECTNNTKNNYKGDVTLIK